MARLIVLGLVIAGVVFIERRFRQRARGAASETPRFTPTVRCDECGAYIATDRAVVHGDGHRCAEHDSATRG